MKQEIAEKHMRNQNKRKKLIGYGFIKNGKTTIFYMNNKIPTQTANPSGDKQPDKAIAMPNYMRLSGECQEKEKEILSWDMKAEFIQ